jgi:hypothetical protein
MFQPGDTVKLLVDLSEYNLPVGTLGTVTAVFEQVGECEVQFWDSKTNTDVDSVRVKYLNLAPGKLTTREADR